MSSFDDDLANAKKLLDMLGVEHPKYLDAYTLFESLKENISKAELYGDTNELTASRNQIRRQLNKISLEFYRRTIDKLGGSIPTSSVNLPSSIPSVNSSSTPDIVNKDGKRVFISHSSKDKPFVDRLEQGSTQSLLGSLG